MVAGERLEIAFFPEAEQLTKVEFLRGFLLLK
jgi:hypothetical protein